MTSSHGSPSSGAPDWADLTMHARRKPRVTAPAAGGEDEEGGAVVASGSCCSQLDRDGDTGAQVWRGAFVRFV